jgi:hypothetical protein
VPRQRSNEAIQISFHHQPPNTEAQMARRAGSCLRAIWLAGNRASVVDALAKGRYR